MTMVSSQRVTIITSALIVCLFFCELCHSQGHTRRRQRNRNAQAVLPNGLQSAYQAAFNQQVSTPAWVPANHGPPQDDPQAISSRNEWDRYTPSTPASNSIECYVERRHIELVGGRCTRLGGSRQPYICQSGMHFDFMPECRQILQNRQRSVS